MVDDTPVPRRFCSDACADTDLFREELTLAEPTPAVAEAFSDLEKLNARLNARRFPSEIPGFIGRVV